MKAALMNLANAVLPCLWFTMSYAAAVNITPDLESIVVTHQGKSVEIRRNQDPENVVNPIYAKTSRECPPFCIQPIELAAGVETIGELELLDYLQKKERGDAGILIIDSRTPDWVKRGTIPGAINIPWTKLTPSAGADPFEMAEIFSSQFDAIEQEGFWNFSRVKTLVLFCNGPWCGQSPTNIKTLLKLGYPADKIKWYRGGMQNWENLGLTVVK